MCYYLYGSLYGDVSDAEYNEVQEKYDYKIHRGTKHDIKNAVKAAVENASYDYRITDWICDCDSPVGKHNPNDPMIVKLSSMIADLSALHNAKQINICKTWTGKRNKREINLQLKSTDLPTFLADLEENCLYTFDI